MTKQSGRADYTTTTGGAGSGEYVKVKFDTTKLTYQMQFLESSVPTSAGQVNNTRAGLTISGAFHHPTTLPTAEQNRCAFVLDSGATSDGAYSVTINRADPPMLFVGNGVVGGDSGATIAFAGIPLLPGVTLGVVPSRTFDFYPFIGFTDTETDFTKVAGNYNEVGIHLSPIGGDGQSRPGRSAGSPTSSTGIRRSMRTARVRSRKAATTRVRRPGRRGRGATTRTDRPTTYS